MSRPFSAYDAALYTIKNLDAFLAYDQYLPTEEQGNARFIFEARQIIDQVDPHICDFLANFNLSVTPKEDRQLSPRTVEKLQGTPQEFLMSLVRYIDFHETSKDVTERNIQTLAGFVAQRFLAISMVAHGKKLEGEKTSFHPKRHEKVLQDRSSSIARSYNELSTCRKVFGGFMEAGCNIQDPYINDTHPSISPITTKLLQIGVQPLLKL